VILLLLQICTLQAPKFPVEIFQIAVIFDGKKEKFIFTNL